MKKQWEAVLGIVIACSLLAGCGSRPENIRGVQLLAPSAGQLQNEAGEKEPLEASQSEYTEMSLPDSTESDQAADGVSGTETEDDMTEEGIREFSYRLVTEYLEQFEQENPILSPVSAYMALSMAAAGAQGETAAELESLLGENHRQLSGRCMSLFDGRAGVELELANSAWLDQSLRAKDLWQEEVQRTYGGEIYLADLSSRQTMEAINTWTREHTQGLVKDFLQQPMSETARLALLNTLYLEADWWSSFEGYATQEQTWYREDGGEKQADTMHKGLTHFDYVADADMDGVILPFQGEELVFLAIRPQAEQTVRELYKQLTPGQISDLLAGREERLMNVSLPKFTVSCDQELDDLLQNMGVERAFDPVQADFSGLGADEKGQPVYIALVRQKALIELSEDGVKAGAATIVEMRAGGGMYAEEPLEMNLDRPFVYMILDLETQVPLFVGIMDDPG